MVFKTARISRTISSMSMGMAKRAYKWAFNAYLRHILKPVSTEFTDLPDFIEYCKQIPNSASVEIMLHPGLAGEVAFEDAEKFWRRALEQNMRIEL